jgi:ribonuclease HI
VGVVLISPQGDKMKYVLRMNFSLPTNNEAEYEPLLHGMRMAKACGATRLDIYGDSNLVVQQSMNLCDAISSNIVVTLQTTACCSMPVVDIICAKYQSTNITSL